MKTHLWKAFFTALVCSMLSSKVYAKKHSLSGLDLTLSYQSIAETGSDLSQNQTEFSVGYDYDLKTKNFDFSADFFMQGASYFDYVLTAPELYTSYKFGKGSSLSLGRKKNLVSLFIDEDWRLGVDAAFNRFLPFEARMQGRLAAFYSYKSDSIDIEIFGSPFSIPDQGASYDFKNGRVSSNNPWVSLPPSSLSLAGGENFNLGYEVRDDQIPNLIANAQYGASFAIRSESLKVSAHYSNKPSKQIGFLINPVLNTDAVGQLEVTAKPYFLREHFFGVQVESDWFQVLKVKNSFYGLAVDSSEIDRSASYQTSIQDYFFVLTSLEYEKDQFSARLGHLYQRRRPFEDESIVYIENNRFLHGTAFNLDFKLKYRSKNELSFNVLYATEEKGLNGFLTASRKIKKNFRVFSRLQLIKDFSDEEAESSFSNTSFSNYASLDSFRLGVQYEF